MALKGETIFSLGSHWRGALTQMFTQTLIKFKLLSPSVNVCFMHVSSKAYNGTRLTQQSTQKKKKVFRERFASTVCSSSCLAILLLVDDFSHHQPTLWQPSLLDLHHARYSPGTDSWSTDVAPLSGPRSGVCLVAMDGYLYAIGGHDGITAMNTVERYCSRMSAPKDHYLTELIARLLLYSLETDETVLFCISRHQMLQPDCFYKDLKQICLFLSFLK